MSRDTGTSRHHGGVRGPPDEVYNHLQPLTNTREHSKYLQIPSNIFEHFRTPSNPITIGSWLSTTTLATLRGRRSLVTLSERHSNHQRCLMQLGMRFLMADRQARFHGFASAFGHVLFYFVTQFLYIVAPSAGKTLDFSLWFSLARCVYIFSMF
jgi:hypothetical protein